MDILFKNDDFVFSYRVGGILKHNGKILLQRPKNDDYAASRSPVPQEKPISKSSGCRLGRGFANATGKVPIIDMMCSPNSLPSASRHASPRFVATSPSRIYGRYSASSFVSFFVVTVHAPVPCAGLCRGVLPPPAPVHAVLPAPRGVCPCSAGMPNTL